MAIAKTLDQALLDLRRLAPTRHRRIVRLQEAAALIARLAGSCRTVGIEERAGGIAFRLQSGEGASAFVLTCVLHRPAGESRLTTAEQDVAGRLCEGRTLAQIAQLRGVSANTVKSQVRNIFRKMDVESRVALVRRLCP